MSPQQLLVDGVGPRFSNALEELLGAHIAELRQARATVASPCPVSMPRSKSVEGTSKIHTLPHPTDDGEPIQFPVHHIRTTEQSASVHWPYPTDTSFPPVKEVTSGRPSHLKKRSQQSSGSERNSVFQSTASMASMNSQTTELTEFAHHFFQGRNTLSRASTHSWGVSVHLLIDNADQESRAGFIFRIVMPLIILLGCLVAFAQSIESLPVDRAPLRLVDLGFNAVFFIEAVVRISVHPNPWNLLCSSHSLDRSFLLIDLISAIPVGLLFTRTSDGTHVSRGNFNAGHFILFNVTPALRLLKILRYMTNLHLLHHAVRLILEAMPVMLFVMFIIMWFFASLLVVVEPSDNIFSLHHALWAVVITMTTVGYGDVYPVSVEGRFISAVLAVVSLLYMAMPLGIIGNIFTNVWNDRDRLLLMQKTRDRLVQWGYKAHDIPDLFQQFDASGTGALDIFSFQSMITEMNIGFDEKRTHALFMQFDDDRSGTVDAPEFIRHLFPKAFHQIYGQTWETETSSYYSTSPRPSEGARSV